MWPRRKRVLFYLLPVLLVATVAFAQTVRLQDGGSANLTKVNPDGSLNFIASGSGTGCDTNAPINVTPNSQIISGATGKNVFICAIVLISASAQNLSVVEGTGATCGTNTAGMVGGAAASMAVAANGGFSSVAGSPWIRTATAGDSVCLFISAGGNVSGVITYHQQ